MEEVTFELCFKGWAEVLSVLQFSRVKILLSIYSFSCLLKILYNPTLQTLFHKFYDQILASGGMTKGWKIGWPPCRSLPL